MKQLLLLLILLSGCLRASSQGFIVNKFHADVVLRETGYFEITEQYDVTFTEARHGIYREVLTDYTLEKPDGNKEKRLLKLTDIAVPGHNFSVNYAFEQKIDGSLKIKIGDKDKLVTGPQHYEIHYKVYNGFLFDDSTVQFYWNLKPADWLTIFQDVSFSIHTPSGYPLSAANCFVYAGPTGTGEPTTQFQLAYQDGLLQGQSLPTFFSGPGSNITVLIKLPASAIQKNFITVPLWRQYAWIGILGLLLLIFWRVWWRYGRDDKVIATTSYYPPKGIDPAMAGYLINDWDDASDLIALLPEWASQGLLEFTEIPKKRIFGKEDIVIKKLKDLPTDAAPYEMKMFNGLFGATGNTVMVSSLKNTFYTTMAAAKNSLQKSAEIYYVPQATTLMKISMGIAIALGVLLTALFLFVWGPVAAVAAAVVCLFIAAMSFYIRKKNSRGNAILSELKGFRQFIKVAEIHRIEMLLQTDPQYFEKTMSYALAFGMLEKWADKFNSLDLQPPGWYHSTGPSMMRFSAFSTSFSSSMRFAQSTMVSAPSGTSSGGGSSGGGFGGGGGGSW